MILELILSDCNILLIDPLLDMKLKILLGV